MSRDVDLRLTLEGEATIRHELDQLVAGVARVRRILDGDRVGDGDGTDRPEVPRDETIARLHIPGLVHAPQEGDSGEWIETIPLPPDVRISRILARFTVVTGPLGTLRDRPQHHLFQIGHPTWGEGSWNLWIKEGRGSGIIAGFTVSKGVKKKNEVKRIDLAGLPARFDDLEIEQDGDRVSAARGALVFDAKRDGVVLPSAGPLKIQLGATLGVAKDDKVPSFGWRWHDLTVEVWG